MGGSDGGARVQAGTRAGRGVFVKLRTCVCLFVCLCVCVSMVMCV